MPLNNFGLVDIAPSGHSLYRCAQPDVDGAALLIASGVRTVVKLNDESEYPAKKESVDFGPAVDIRLCPISTFEPTVEATRMIVSIIRDALDQEKSSVLVHCTHGRDRTGLVIGAYRLLVNNWTLDQVNAERELYGVAWIIKLADHEIGEVLEEIAKAAPAVK